MTTMAEQNEIVPISRKQIVRQANEAYRYRMEDIEKLAEAVARSRMFGITTKEQALVLMSIAQAEGRHPAEAARDYNIIQGRPAKTSEAMMRDLIAAGGRVKWHQLTDDAVEATFSHPAGGEIRILWDTARAQKAGLAAKEMWKKYPRQMLRSRCVSEGVRTVCPMATSGMYVPEEVRDMPAIDTEPSPASDTTADLDTFAGQRVEEEGYPGSLVPPRREPPPVTEPDPFGLPPRREPPPVTEPDPFGLPPLPIRNEKPSPRRSAIWQEQSYRIAATELLDGTPDWDKWASDIEFLIGEASREEIDKLREDNKELLQQLRRSERSDRYRDITIAADARRTDLHEEAKQEAGK
jgi:hypothetical protein